jgi:hypothetical protein
MRKSEGSGSVAGALLLQPGSNRGLCLSLLQPYPYAEQCVAVGVQRDRDGSVAQERVQEFGMLYALSEERGGAAACPKLVLRLRLG